MLVYISTPATTISTDGVEVLVGERPALGKERKMKKKKKRKRKRKRKEDGGRVKGDYIPSRTCPQVAQITQITLVIFIHCLAQR